MTDTQILIDEYGVPEPSPDNYDSDEVYLAAYNAWFEGFANWVIRKSEEEEAARIAEEEAHRQAEEAAARLEKEQEQSREEQAAAPLPGVNQGTSDRYPVGSYIDEAGSVWSSAGELLSPEISAPYSSGVYVDPAGNLWSEDGELLSPGTTPAMEPGVNELAGEIVGEPVTGEPVIDTAILLLDLLDALIGEDGMTDDVDGIQEAVEGIQQALDHPLMTTSFQDYNVTEGLLLLLLLSAFVAACAKMLKGGFSWLR